MIRVQKGNVQYRIREEELAAYEKRGYSQVGAEDQTVDKPVSRMGKDELLARAVELGITVPDGTTNDAIRKLITAAQ